jgi:hypothetical protein
MGGFLRALACALLLLSLGSCGGGGGSSGERWLFPLWVQTDVVVADIDGDGRADVITLAQVSYSMSQREGRLSVRLQTVPGVFTPAQNYVVGMYPWKMAIADIDGDGAPDLVLTDVGSTSSADGRAVWMLRQDLTNRGRFLAPQRLMSIDSASTIPYDVAIGDVNGDGAPDVVVASSIAPGRGATLLPQDAAHRGTFLVPALIPLPGDATAVALGDLNGDGRADLVFRMFLSQTSYVPSTALGVVYQQAGGTLAAAVSLSPQTGLNTAYLTVTDYNADGVRDVVEFFTPSSTDYQAKITTLLQAPVGTFAAVNTSLAWVKGIDDGVAADLNGDGRPDFASVGFYPEGSPSYINSSLNVFLQDGSGGFNPAASIAMPIAASRLAAADVNGDGLTDLVVLGDGFRVLVLLQSAAIHGTFLSPVFLN